MNDYSKTKPAYTETVATSRGWEDAKTGELLVAIDGLDKKLGVALMPVVPVKRGAGRPKGSLAKPKAV